MADKREIVPAPLFRDPIYDGATDPTVIWNREEKCWWMLYTQRRSSDITIGVSNIHGTRIGVASSTDGNRWLYRGVLGGLDFESGHNTFWAPEVIWAQGEYHMYVSYITGIPTDWCWPRHIVHYTASNLWHWKMQSVLPLSSDRVIDACVQEIAPHRYKMWYKDETHNSHTYCALSDDLYNWRAGEAEITDCSHEGPNVFELSGKRWMITDCWDGLAVYETDDFINWSRQEGNLLRTAGIRQDDGTLGHHADVVSRGEKAFLFYFTHPEFTQEKRKMPGFVMGYAESHTSIQVAQLKVIDGKLCCDRDAEMVLELSEEK